jgi:hypothetical protein
MRGSPRSRRWGAVRGRRARRRAREGAVMLVVMLVLMVATASAAVSVTTIQSELQAAGHDRMAMQARYVAETAMMTTISYIDVLFDTGQWEQIWRRWAGSPPPVMNEFGRPPINNTRTAIRTTMEQHDALQIVPASEVTPVNRPDENDVSGSFGPRQGYGPMLHNNGSVLGYVVDITDCHIAPSGGTPGSPVGGGPGSLSIVQFYCVVTARARLQQIGTANLTRRWDYGGAAYFQNAFSSAHESRAAILTPAVAIPLN